MMSSGHSASSVPYVLNIFESIITISSPNISTCADLYSCSTCVSNDKLSCVWCSDSSSCGDSSSTHCSQSPFHTCDDTLYTVVFIVLLVLVVCICCGGCYLRRSYRGVTGESLTLAASARAFIFRNSLLSIGQKEWMCVICGFDNHPRTKHCNMCGTTHEFSDLYKKDKKERKKLLLEKKREAKALAKNQKSLVKQKPSSSVAFPKEAQISSHHIASLSQSVSHDKSTSRQSSILTSEKRTSAQNYKRLNQLTLRQKSSRRRKIWQRIYDQGTGNLRWVRVQVSDIRINGAPFGYTPRNSLSEINSISLKSNSAGNSLETSRILLEAAASGRDSPHSKDSSTNSVTSSIVIPGIANYALSNGTSIAKSHNHRNREHSDDSFGDSGILSSSPGYTTIIDKEGNLGWERVDTVKPNTPLLFSLKGATSVSNGRPNPLNSIDRRNMNFSALSLAADNNMSTPLLSSDHGEGITISIPITVTDERDAFMRDLETVASLTFREKQLWFIDRMSELQVPWSEGCVRIEVRREELLDDSVKAFNAVPASELHKWMRVQFLGEPGIDAGGLEREWFELVTKELFSQQRGLFLCSAGEAEGGSYHINPVSPLLHVDKSVNIPIPDNSAPSSSSKPKITRVRSSASSSISHLDYFKFAGRLIGKALMEQQPLPATLSLPLRKQILTTPITFSDLEFVDSDLYKNLVYLLDDCEDVSALSMDFTVTYRNNGKTLHCNLIEGGENVNVTNANKESYLQLRLRHRMFDSIRTQLEAMLKGIYEIIPPDLLSVFDYQELDMLVCGQPEIDVEDWKTHTEYLGEYNRLGAKHRVIKWFWKAIDSMGREERVRLLQFVTGCGRLPAQGFKALQSNDGKYRKFNIQSINKKDSIYPRAHTCFNKLDLPVYDSPEELDAYLSVVINMEITGFSME